jgi:hypothetical protein
MACYCLLANKHDVHFDIRQIEARGLASYADTASSNGTA